MNKSIKITVIIIGVITLCSFVFSLIKGNLDEVSYFALFIGAALIGTALFTKTIEKKNKG